MLSYYMRNKIVGVFIDKYIEYESDSDDKLTINEYLENTKPYLCDMINNLMMTK